MGLGRGLAGVCHGRARRGSPYKPELKDELRRQLLEARVELILGSPLRQAPPTPPGELGTFTVTTEAGTELLATLDERLRAAEAQLLAPLDLETRDTFRAQVRLLATRAESLDPL
ncbi:MAG: hypothetical protein E6I85_15175 [Chloroflexi bacterium]|nr:MAG: hypothetical protein E6I85_15175 [Chloroflexota bacterium]